MRGNRNDETGDRRMQRRTFLLENRVRRFATSGIRSPKEVTRREHRPGHVIINFTEGWPSVEERQVGTTRTTTRRQYVVGDLRYIDDLDCTRPGTSRALRAVSWLSVCNFLGRWRTGHDGGAWSDSRQRPGSATSTTPTGNLSVFGADFTTRSTSSYRVCTTPHTKPRWDSDAGLYYFRNRWYRPAIG